MLLIENNEDGGFYSYVVTTPHWTGKLYLVASQTNGVSQQAQLH